MTDITNATCDISMASNPLITFIHTAGLVSINMDYDACITFARFRELFHQWCKSSNIPGSGKLEQEHYVPVFQEYGLYCVQDERKIQGRMTKGIFICGLEERLAGGAMLLA